MSRPYVKGEAVIYLASPYSHADPLVREARWRAACRAAAEMMRRGELVFSPIAHSHSMCEVGLPGDWSFWREFDQRMIAACDEVRVLMLDGWDTSPGVSAEVDLAHDLGIPVTFFNVGATHVSPDGCPSPKDHGRDMSRPYIDEATS